MSYAGFRAALGSFDVAEYTRRVLTRGGREVAADQRTVVQVTELAAAAAGHRSRWGGLYGERVGAVVELADAFLGAQTFLLTNERPRYVPYAAMPVLRHVLGIDRSLASGGARLVPRARVWTVFRDILDALLDTERSALAGGWRGEQFDAEVVGARVRALAELRQRIPVEFRTPTAARVPPSEAMPPTLAGMAADRSGALAVRHLMALPQSRFHDEISFLRLIQLAECLFHGSLVYVRRAKAALWVGRTARAAELVRTAADFATPLVNVFHVVRVMPPAHFLAFRPATGDASAVQSVSWQALDAHVYGLHPEKLPVLCAIPEVRQVLDLDDPGFVPLVQATGPEGRNWSASGSSMSVDGRAWYDLADAVDLLDRRLRAWTGFHERQLAARRDPAYLPPSELGTGGTRGQPYLARTLRKRRSGTRSN